MPLPYVVLATFCLTAGGLIRPPEEGAIIREKTIIVGRFKEIEFSRLS
jgi:hypothetical protein